jgi:hypothetical protein
VRDLWVEGSTVYIGAEQGGARVLDIGGRAGRRRRGLVYVADAGSELWILRLGSESAQTP